MFGSAGDVPGLTLLFSPPRELEGMPEGGLAEVLLYDDEPAAGTEPEDGPTPAREELS